MSISSAGNPTTAKTVIVKSGPKAGTATTVHTLVNAGSTDVEVILASRTAYIRQQEGIETIAREAMAKTEIADFCKNLAGEWPDAVEVRIDSDEDGDEMAWATLLDGKGEIVSGGSDEEPSNLLGQYDYELIRLFEGQTLNIADTAAKASTTLTGTNSVFAHEQTARAAGANIAHADMSDFCGEVASEWPDAVSARFDEDLDGDEFLWVTLLDKSGNKIDVEDEAQNKLQTFDFDRISAFTGWTVNIEEYSTWKPALDTE